MTDLVFLAPNTQEPFTTSEVIAECAAVAHDTVQKMITRHEADFKSFGLIGFEIRKPPEGSKGGRPQKIYHLNEQQATLLLTYLRNSDAVRAFKMELVRQFFQMRQELTNVRVAKAERKPIRKTVTDAVKALPDSPNKKWKYKQYTDLAYMATVGQTAKAIRESRNADKKATASDYLTSAEIEAVSKAENKIGVLLECGFEYDAIKSALMRGIGA